ncbi:MAG TPA: CDP-diacylglycerol--glycerol-3-phosphate 3-phosphatidyltransferase [Chloroflexota bacterium]|nr:CDP-diacylglycerol--glycerol-3-phosphate 3-phosphatidyltransferase [Chloroflexota bacterium]
MGTGVVSWPQLLSLSRILAAVPVAALIFRGDSTSYLIAAALFAVASLTDLLDGPLARRGQTVGPLGIYLDTTADKVLVSVVLVGLSAVHLVDAWMTMVIVAREFLVLGIRTLAGAQGFVVSPNLAGKVKAFVTMAAIVIVLLWAAAEQGGFGMSGSALNTARSVAWSAMALATVLTLWSGIQYLVDARPLYSGGAARGSSTSRASTQSEARSAAGGVEPPH